VLRAILSTGAAPAARGFSAPPAPPTLRPSARKYTVSYHVKSTSSSTVHWACRAKHSSSLIPTARPHG